MELLDVKTLPSHHQFTFLHNNEKRQCAYHIFIFIKKCSPINVRSGNIFLNVTCYSFIYGRSESCRCYFDLSKQQIDYIASALRFEVGLYKRSTKKMLNMFLNHELTKKVIGL